MDIEDYLAPLVAIPEALRTSEQSEQIAKLQETVEHTRNVLAELWTAGNFQTYIDISKGSTPWTALCRIASEEIDKRVTRAQLAKWFGDVWTGDTRTTPYTLQFLIRTIGPKHHRHIMCLEDLKAFDLLPETFAVYRGAKRRNVAGMSWTLSKDVARNFTKRGYGCKGSVDPAEWDGLYERTVSKSSVLFYTNEREEQEVVLKRRERGRLIETTSSAIAA